MDDVIVRSIQEIFPTIAVIIAIVVALEVVLYFVLKRWLNLKYALAYMLITPAVIGLILLVVVPIFYNVGVAFSNINLTRLPSNQFNPPSYGFDIFISNISKLFTQPVLIQEWFGMVFLRTVIWTAMQVSVHVVLGLGVAMLLNRPMKLRGLYRTLILIPWAVPQVIALLAWRTEFNFDWGFINIMLRNVGLPGVQWQQSPVGNFMAMNIANWWLGVPFMSVVLLGGLQSINHAYYEAANMDGASKWQQFRKITLPLIQPVMTPAVILGVIWTFNNILVPFIINSQEKETSDILVTAVFRAAFEYSRFGFGAAFTLVIFFILSVFTVIYMKLTGFFNDVGSGTKQLAATKAVGG
jgi:arabinogalactan oligomer/maltooligosaccharide transport system permease protein